MSVNKHPDGQQTAEPESSVTNLSPYVLPVNVPSRGNRFSRGLGKLCLWLMGWKLTGVFPNHKKLVLIVAPHTSNWDFVIGIATYLAIGLRAHWFGKHTLFSGVFGRLLKWMGGIPVQRTMKHGFVEQLVEKFNQADQMVLGLSPEGTRKKTQAWKKGYYYIAHGAHVPILLISLDYTKKEFEFGPVVWPDGDYEKQTEEIMKYYHTKTPKKPELF